MATYPITPQTLPSGFCPPTYQALLNGFSSNQFVTIPDSNSKLIVSATKPDDFTAAWLRLDSSGRPTYIYYFAQGSWLSLHPIQPGLTMWWFGSPDLVLDATTIKTFDGGADEAPSLYTGPMWQFARIGGTAAGTVIAAQFPIVSGTLESLTVLNLGDVGGEEKHSLTQSEMPPHTHDNKYISFSDGPSPGGDDRGFWKTTDANPQDGTIATENAGGNGATPPVVVAHNNLPPFVVGFLLQRTSRRWLSVS